MRLRVVGFAALLPVFACGGAPEEASRSVADALPCAPDLPRVSFPYSDADSPLPAHFVTSTAGTVVFSDNMPAANRTTNAGATLGRVLFYDARLSADDEIACATCHRQEFGFGDTVPFRPGVSGEHLPRRTLPLANARFNPSGRFAWDERTATLEEQVLEPIRHPDEMGLEIEAAVRKLSAAPYYPGLFTAAFGSPEVTEDRIAAALAQFVRSLVSADSRFDAVYLTGGAPDPTRLTDEEREGFRLFNRVGCVNCHRTIAQFADKANNNGLDAVPADTGAGQGRFKPASLRNVAVRPPYMHDGRFRTLREVVEFYAGDVRDGPDLDARLRASDGTPRRLDLSARDAEALVAFLESLTDSSFLQAEKFSSPFPDGCSFSVGEGTDP